LRAAIGIGLLMLLIAQYFQVPWWHYLLVAYFANSLTRNQVAVIQSSSLFKLLSVELA